MLAMILGGPGNTKKERVAAPLPMLK